METLDPNSICNSNLESSNKRLKTQQSSVPCSVDKGKAPIVADDFDESEDDYESPSNSTPESCGICLSEEGKTVRGLIDSCEHYFCFLCIIEWSKVESRCPLCRGRFSSIRRMRKDGSFIGEGSVRVPVRDQIYDPFGQPADPYSQAKCSVCNGTNDECLLLLCDLCDSASHTFCVGLGATVPEGDWYCRDCTVLRAEQHNNEMGDNVVTSTVSPRVNEPSSSASVSIFDIVRDPDESMVRDSGTDRLLQLVSQRPTNFPSSVAASDRSIIASDRSISVTRGNLHPSIDVSESSARTLRNCRDVRRHINVLRENWDAFRTGSLSFSFAFAESAGKSSERENVVGTSAKRSCTLQPLSSARSSQSNAVDSLCEVAHNKESYNVDRAWKLMNIAKTEQQTDKSKGASKVAPNKAHSIKKNKMLPKSVQSGRRDLMLPKLEKQKTDVNASESAAQSSRKPHFISFGATVLGNKHQKSCVNKLSMPREIQTALKANSYKDKSCLASSKNLKGARTAVLDDGSAWSSSSFGPMAEVPDASCARLPREISVHPVKKVGHLNISVSSKGELQTCQADIGGDKIGLASSADKTGLASSANLGRGLSNNSDGYNSFACSTSSNERVGGDSDASHVNLEGQKKPAYPGKVGAKITSKSNKDDEAKGEIQSLVKLNLKLLSKDKKLGVDEFKEIARLSTHTILASCGFEHRKIVSSLPTLQCHHDDETQQLYRSKIMPNCCRECFYVFVKNVVNSIMSEKLNSAEVAS